MRAGPLWRSIGRDVGPHRVSGAFLAGFLKPHLKTLELPIEQCVQWSGGMNSKIFKLLLAYQRLDDALRLKMAAGSSNALEILRLKARKQDLKLRLRSVSSSRPPLPAA
jgi:hypothetical protein